MANDQSGGAGPFLTKDQFYQEMKEVRDRQDANKADIVGEIKDAFRMSKADCDDQVEAIEGRVVRLEGQAYWGKIIASVVGGLAAVATAISVFWNGGN